MKLLLKNLLLCAALIGGTVACRGKVPEQAPKTIEPQTQTTLAPTAPPQQVDTLVVHSAKMGRDIKNLVVLPEQYFTNGDERFNVVYLLHGYDGDFTNWNNHCKSPTLSQLATRFNIIIVCPDGQDAWYIDSPINPKSQFATYMTRELLAAVDSTFRTNANAKGRAITGLSMGGHGALYLAFSHPELFGSCGSMSGHVNLTYYEKFRKSWKLPTVLGAYNEATWRKYTARNLVSTLKPGQLNIIFDDGFNDIFYDANVELHQALLKAGIDHKWTARPGKHSWSYWIASLPEHLTFFDQAFNPSHVPQ